MMDIGMDPTAALLADGTGEVAAQLVGARPASAGRRTASDVTHAAQLSAVQAHTRAASRLEHVLEAEQEQVDDEAPMTEAEIRVLEEDPPPPPVQAELPLQFPTKGPGVYTTYRGPDERRTYLVDKKELRRLEELKQTYDALADRARDARGTLEIEEEKLRDLRQEAATNPSLAPQQLFYQEQEVEKAWARLTEAEQTRDHAELQLHHQVEKTSDIERAVALEEMNMATLASARQQDEVRRARQKVRSAEKELKSELLAENAAQADRDRRQEDADRLQKEGQARLRKEQARSRGKDTKMQELRDAAFEHKAKRHTTLKESITRISNTIHAENERRRKQQAAKLDAQDSEKKELIAAGLNPYEVFRRRELEKEQVEQKVKSAALKEMRQEQLLEKIAKEDVLQRKQEETVREEHATAAEFQREMGGLERRRKVTEYIREQTIGCVDVLDPTGTAIRIDPSKVTVQKTKDFGLGRAPVELISRREKALGKMAQELRRGGQDGEDDDFVFEQQQEIGESSKKGPWEPKLTKLEQQYMAEAALRQQANITSVQRCWGREFAGQAFLAQPAVIAFTDFDVGQKYKQVIQLTNVSLTFNQFKLLPLDDMINDFFEVEFHPPGRMSAGTTCSVTLWFLPKKNRDIYTEFPILSKTGPISFPLQATTKKTVLQMTPQDRTGQKIIDFGDVLLGESCNRTLTVINSGALGSDFTLHLGDSEFVQMIKCEPSTEKFHAKKTTKLPFHFKPTKIGQYETRIRIEVHNPYVEPQFVVVRGQCVDVPIYVEHESYDFKTIIAGHVFRENVVIHNRRSQSMTIRVIQPRQIEHELSYIPSLAYIQGNSRMVIQFKLSLKHDFLSRYPQYKSDSGPNAFRIPVKIRGSDQELPVGTTLLGTLTTNDLTFDPPQVHFGNCFVDSCAMQEVRIKNESLLPQKFAFVRMPPHLSVQVLPFDAVADQEQEDRLQRLNKEHPDRADGIGWGWSGIQADACVDGGGFGGFGTLLPQEKTRLLVTYTPHSATEMNTGLIFKVQSASLCAREFGLPCRGQGILPSLVFNCTTVEMAAVPSNALIKESIEVTNMSKTPQKMNLLIPPDHVARLAVCPVCCVLEPRETKRVQFEFKPTDEYVNFFHSQAGVVVEDEEEDEDEKVEKSDTPVDEEDDEAVKLAAEANLRRAKEAEERAETVLLAKKGAVRRAGGRRWEGPTGSQHALWKIPVCIMPVGSKEHVQGGTRPYLAVRTTTVPHVLTADPHEVNFQEVTVRQRVIRRITIRNFHAKAQTLRMDPLPENACFMVLDALREVRDRPFQIVVAFIPEFAQVYSTVLRLYSEDTRIQVRLKGKGVRPVLEIEPESGVVDFGAVCHQEGGHDFISIPIQVKNASPFEMHYSLDTDLVSDFNPFGVQPFTATPGTAVVPGNEHKEVVVKFQPHRPWAGYRHRLLVNVPNQQKKTYFSFYGMCFRYQMYCVYNTPITQIDELERTPIFKTSLVMGDDEQETSKDPKAKPDVKPGQPLSFDLSFDAKAEDGDQLKLYLMVGCAAPPGTRGQVKDGPGGSAEFVVQPSAHSKYFSVEPTKVSVGLGKQEKVAFIFTPPKERDLTIQGLTLDLLDQIGQWVSASVKGTLTGGYSPPGMPAAQEVAVNLRAYLCQI